MEPDIRTSGLSESQEAGLEHGHLRIAKIPYLNSEPFYRKLNQPGFDVVEMTPRELGRAARAGIIDAGLMAVADYFSLEDSFEIVGPFGICAKREVNSVLLFSARPIEELGGRQIDLTSQSSTSVRLLRIILEEKYGLKNIEYRRSDSTEYGSAQHATAALLLIGDLALRARLDGVPGMPHLYDLGAEWFDWKQTPFTFAVWTVRRIALPEAKERLRGALEESLHDWTRYMRELSIKFGAQFGGADFVQKYWAGFDYVISEPAMAAIKEFRRYCNERFSSEL